MGLSQLLTKDIHVTAIVCNQFGDSGKGKFVDFFAEWADVIARGTGGANAGHTVKVNGSQRIYHLLPSAIAQEGKINVLGQGMVIDPWLLVSEIEETERSLGRNLNNLLVSEDAHVTMPWHVAIDKAKYASLKNGGIGSTGKGIGITYADKAARPNIQMRDLLSVDRLARKIEQAKKLHPDQQINADEIIERLKPAVERLRQYIADTNAFIHKAYIGRKRILLEGAQGLLLSVEHGTYPYVTSSDCSLNGTASGVGLPATAIDLPLGIIKFPFMTRVGGGPFPTELGGRDGEGHCEAGREHDIFFEVKEYLGMNVDLERVRHLQKNPSPAQKAELTRLETKAINYISANSQKVLALINSSNPFEQGIGIRMAGFEYGATTKRPRRIGWTDAVAARYAVAVNGPRLILTKPDTLSGAESFSVCCGYEYSNNETSETFTRDSERLKSVKPLLKKYTGYGEVRDIDSYRALPSSLRFAILDFESFTGGHVDIISVGPDREETIVR